MELINYFSEEYINSIREKKSSNFFNTFCMYISEIENYAETDEYQELASIIEKKVQIVSKGNILVTHGTQMLSNVDQSHLYDEISMDVCEWCLFEEDYYECNLFILCINADSLEQSEEIKKLVVGSLTLELVRNGYGMPHVLVLHNSKSDMAKGYELFCFK